jgi:hypothetical protein
VGGDRLSIAWCQPNRVDASGWKGASVVRAAVRKGDPEGKNFNPVR